jgi:hypothetical protein
MGKASTAEWEALVEWFNRREAAGEYVPLWRRVVFGFDVVVGHACDPDASVLDWKPEIRAAMDAAERLAALVAIEKAAKRLSDAVMKRMSAEEPAPEDVVALIKAHGELGDLLSTSEQSTGEKS